MISYESMSIDNYKHIPEVLKKFILECINSKIDNQLINALCHNCELTLKAISEMFEIAEKFTNLNCNELFAKTGFNPSDKSGSRVDSSFAEIRAINFLGLNGFENIEIIHNKVKKYADLIAYRCNKKVCFEVMCISNEGKEKWTEIDIVNFINFRLIKKGKIDQLINTQVDYNCHFMNLVVVIVTNAGIALNNREDYLRILKKVHEINRIDQLTYSIVTGKVDGFTQISDDCIYPELF